ncbi:MAG: peptidoglycan DD-metalloendopeptidase family protein [Lachnospiraceae bacterium]|nr:peptidoglycan DD-metalloendopeptidase family protein [Lachnospiraceae bacterium]
MKKYRKRILAFILCASMFFCSGITAYADKKSDAQEEIDRLEEQQKELQKKVEELKAHKESTQAYINQLDEQIRQLLAQIQVKQDEINAKEQEIEAIKEEIEITKAELEEAKKREAQQYDALKSRFQVMYENGKVSEAQKYLQLIMGADDLEDVFAAQNYMAEMSNYDAVLWQEFVDTKNQIAAYEAQLEADEKKLEEEKEDLENEKKELEIQQQSLEMLISEKEAELVSINEEISDVTDDIAVLKEQEEDNKAIIRAIEAQEAEARRRAQEAAAAQSSGNAGTAASSGGGLSANYGTSNVDTSGLVNTGYYIFPCSGYISSGYGGRSAPTAGATAWHAGIDIAGGSGSPIRASAAGVVTTVAYNSARGNYIVVNHGGGICTLYQHCSAIYASPGQSVAQGQTIAAIGSTGVSTGPHCHFEFWVNGVPVNPLAYVSP